MLRVRGNLLLDQLDRPNERTGQHCLETRPRNLLIRQRKTHRRRRARRIGETSRLSATTEVLFHRHGDIDHPLEVEATGAIEEEDPLEDTQDPVERVHLLDVGGATPGHPDDTADIPCRGAEAVLGTIVTDLLAEEPPRLLRRDAGRPILTGDHVR